MGLPSDRQARINELRRRIAATHAWRDRYGFQDRISFGPPRRNRPEAQAEYTEERVRLNDRREVVAQSVYTAPEGLTVEVDCPLCLALHAHVVDPDFTGGWLQPACGLGVYWVRV